MSSTIGAPAIQARLDSPGDGRRAKTRSKDPNVRAPVRVPAVHFMAQPA